MSVDFLGVIYITNASLMLLGLLVTETIFSDTEACPDRLCLAEEAWLLITESDGPLLGCREPICFGERELLL